MKTVQELSEYLSKSGASPEKLAREIKISNMTIRRMLRRPPETPLPEKYRTLLRLKQGASLFDDAPALAALSSLKRPGQSFDSVLSELESTGAAAAASGEGLERLTDDVHEKLEDRAIDNALRRRVRKVLGLLRAGSLSFKDKAILAGALLYLVNPVDLIPDTIPVVGYLDDLAVITLACDVVVRNARKRQAATRDSSHPRTT